MCVYVCVCMCVCVFVCVLTLGCADVAGVHHAGIPEETIRWTKDPYLPVRSRPPAVRLHQDLGELAREFAKGTDPPSLTVVCSVQFNSVP